MAFWSYSNYTDVIERRDLTVIFPNLTRSYRDFAYMLAWFSCSRSYIDLYSACSAMILIDSGCGSSREEGGIVKQRVGLFHGASMVLLKIHFETVLTKWWYFQKYFPGVYIVRLKNLTVTRINKINHFSVFSVLSLALYDVCSSYTGQYTRQDGRSFTISSSCNMFQCLCQKLFHDGVCWHLQWSLQSMAAPLTCRSL